MAISFSRDDGAQELSRACYFARVSLVCRYRNLLAEDDGHTPVSRLQQADEIEASFRRICEAVNELREDWEDRRRGPSDGLNHLQELCVGMRRRVDTELRGGDQQWSWQSAGRQLISEAYSAVCDIEQAGVSR